MPELCASSFLLWLEASGLESKVASLGGGCCGLPCSPCEIDDNVSPSLLHLGEGQWGHITPDFQSFLDGPSHFSFYELPREPDNSERQQTLDEESISHCPMDTGVMKLLAVGSLLLGLLPSLSTRTSLFRHCSGTLFQETCSK